MRRRIVALAATVLGCGAPSEPTPDAGVCAPPTRAVAATGAAVDVIATVPSPPARFDNAWTIRATTAAGDVATAADIVASAFMPEHGHGTPEPPTVTAAEAEHVAVSGLVLWMPGIWEVRFAVASDLVTFRVCIAE